MVCCGRAVRLAGNAEEEEDAGGGSRFAVACRTPLPAESDDEAQGGGGVEMVPLPAEEGGEGLIVYILKF